MDIFDDPTRNVHSEVARDVFGRPVEKDSLEYTLAKSMVHASNYRMGPGRFASETGLPFGEAQKLLAKFHARFPEIQQWHAEVRQQLITKGTLTTCFGRKRVFYEALGALVVRNKPLTQMQGCEPGVFHRNSIIRRGSHNESFSS